MSSDSRGSVLVVDDEPTIAEVVSRYLERAGYDTRVAGDGPRAIQLAGERRPDLVVLDLMLPGLDGLEVMRRLRELGETSPRERIAVILLTAKGEESDRVIGLRLGADDYVVKPFSPAELVARVDAVLRRVDPAPEKAPPLVHGDLVIDPAARRVYVPGDGGRAHPARIRPAAVPRSPSRTGVLPQPADGRRLAVRVLLRHLDGHRPRAPAAREDRAGPVAPAPPADRVGRRLPVPAVSPLRSALIGSAAALLAAGAVGGAYGCG